MNGKIVVTLAAWGLLAGASACTEAAPAPVVTPLQSPATQSLTPQSPVARVVAAWRVRAAAYLDFEAARNKEAELGRLAARRRLGRHARSFAIDQ